MGTRTFIACAVVVLVFGVVGRITYERTVNTTTPAYAQQADDPRQGLDCDDYDSQTEAQAALEADPTDPNVLDEDNDGEACETFDYGDDTGSASPDPDDGTTTGPSEQYDGGDGSDEILDSGASGPGPVLTLPDGSCIPDYPIKRNGHCYR